jgi:broad specificity phosphatase PhoE
LKTKKIYLVRHGQTEFNNLGIVQGSGVNTDLNETGRQQSKLFYEAYKHIPFDKVYTSTLKRSQQSVQGFVEMGIPTEAHAGLNEISWGTREGMAITPEEDIYYHQVLEAWTAGQIDLPIEGGECPRDVAKRQKPVIDIILSRHEENTILVCMHGRAMRVLLCQLMNYDLRYMNLFDHHNLGLYLLNYTGSMFNIERFNDIDHLKV